MPCPTVTPIQYSHDIWQGYQVQYDYETKEYKPISNEIVTNLPWTTNRPIIGKIYSYDALIECNEIYNLNIEKDNLKVFKLNKYQGGTNYMSGIVLQNYNKNGDLWETIRKQQIYPTGYISDINPQQNNIYISKNNYIIGQSIGSGLIIPYQNLLFHDNLQAENGYVKWTSTPTYETIDNRKAMQFNGSFAGSFNNYLIGFPTTQSFTASVQFYINEYPSSTDKFSLLYGVGSNDQNRGRSFELLSNGLICAGKLYVNTDYSTYIQSLSAVTLNTWHTVVMTYDQSNTLLTLILDNEIQNTCTVQLNIYNTNNYGGVGNIAGIPQKEGYKPTPFKGYLKNIREYTRVLTEVQIEALSRQF